MVEFLFLLVWLSEGISVFHVDDHHDICCRREFCDAPGNPFKKYVQKVSKFCWDEFTWHDKLNFRVTKESVKECVVVLMLRVLFCFFVCFCPVFVVFQKKWSKNAEFVNSEIQGKKNLPRFKV